MPPFVDCAFGVVSKNSSPKPRSFCVRFPPVSPSRSFIVLHLTFRYVIHFELIFVKHVKVWVSMPFFFFYMKVPAPFV